MREGGKHQVTLDHRPGPGGRHLDESGNPHTAARLRRCAAARLPTPPSTLAQDARSSILDWGPQVIGINLSGGFEAAAANAAPRHQTTSDYGEVRHLRVALFLHR